MKRSYLLLSAVSAVVALCASFAPSSATTLADIRARGTLNVGVKADVLSFGYLNPKTNQYEGYEIDIAKEIARRLLGDANKVKFTTVTAKTRPVVLDSGEVDAVIATFTITEPRKLILDFSPPYFTDGIKLLVAKDSGVKSLKDLAGKTIAVAKGADTGTRLQAKATALGFSVNTAAYDTYADDLNALTSGRAQAFATDGSILKFYEQSDPAHLVILPDRYSDEDYGIATKKGNDELRDFIAGVVNDLQKSGTLKRWQQRWGIYAENQSK